MSMLAPTDEPAVTAETRFWLTTRLYLFETIRDRRSGRFLRTELFGKPTVIRVEVGEATYRKVYDERFASGDDITLPLDDDWWSSRAIWHSPDGTFTIWRSVGGHIDWEG